MDDGAERHSVTERRGHVGNFHVSVALRYVLTPLLQAPQSRLPRHARGLYLREHQHNGSLPAVGGVPECTLPLC